MDRPFRPSILAPERTRTSAKTHRHILTTEHTNNTEQIERTNTLWPDSARTTSTLRNHASAAISGHMMPPTLFVYIGLQSFEVLTDMSSAMIRPYMPSADAVPWMSTIPT